MNPQDMSHLSLSESGFLFDMRSGHTYTLNPTGAFLLRRLLDGLPREELVQALEASFEVSPEVALQDLERFLARLRQLGLRRSA